MNNVAVPRISPSLGMGLNVTRNSVSNAPINAMVVQVCTIVQCSLIVGWHLKDSQSEHSLVACWLHLAWNLPFACKFVN